MLWQGGCEHPNGKIKTHTERRETDSIFEAEIDFSGTFTER